MTKINVTKTSENTFADSNVGGSQYLPIGKHNNVRIVEAEDKLVGDNKIPALNLVFENNEGKIAKSTIFYSESVFVDGKRTKDTQISWKLLALSGALIRDAFLREKVFQTGLNDTSRFEDLVGFRCNIEIALPKKGYIIARDGEREIIGVYKLTKKSRELIESFESFDDADAYLKEHKLKRAYSEVSGFSKVVTETGDDINGEAIQAFIAAKPKTSTNKGTVSAIGARAGATTL